MAVTPAPPGRLLLAYASVYLIWGSSYLFMKIAVESLPPLPMAGTRYFIAGLLLVGITWSGISRRPVSAEWRAATITGMALMGSNAAVSYAVTRIPSGVAALLVATTPCWMLLLDWMHDRSRRPHGLVLAGLALGVVGIAILIGPAELLGGAHIDPVGAVAVIVGTLMWAWGSLYGRRSPRHPSSQLVSAMQMLTGGGVLMLLSLASGGSGDLALDEVTSRSWFAFWYLVFVASLGGFTAYVYLLAHVSAARASTYAFVNPVVAVFLGAAFGGEALTPRIGIAAALIVAAVAMIVLAPSAADGGMAPPSAAPPTGTSCA